MRRKKSPGGGRWRRPCSRMLVTGRLCCGLGMFQGAGGRVSTLMPSGAPNVKTLHTRSPQQGKAEKHDPGYTGGFYVGGVKGRNPMKTVGIAWAIGFPSGILLFLYARRKVDQRRALQMKALQRMRDANKGPYQSERYKSV